MERKGDKNSIWQTALSDLEGILLGTTRLDERPFLQNYGYIFCVQFLLTIGRKDQWKNISKKGFTFYGNFNGYWEHKTVLGVDLDWMSYDLLRNSHLLVCDNKSKGLGMETKGDKNSIWQTALSDLEGILLGATRLD